MRRNFDELLCSYFILFFFSVADVFEKSYSVDISIPVSDTERIKNFAEAVTPKLYPLVV